MDLLNSATMLLNQWGRVFCEFGTGMFIQSSLLVGALLLIDLCLRARVSARFRYAMWLLVLAKLVLPLSLALPTGISYWLGRYVPQVSPPAAPVVSHTPPVYVVEPFVDTIAMPEWPAEVTVAGSQVVSLEWPGLVLLGWVAGAVLLSAVVLWQVASLGRSLRRSRPAHPQMVTLLEGCCAELGIGSPVRLRVTDEMRSPCVCGFARPVILLPTSLPRGLSQAGLRTILTHELAHIKRRDPWVSLAQTLLQVAYFWHPLVWIANTKLRHTRESAVDETVLVASRSQTQCYTDTLIDIAEMAFRRPAFSLRLIGIAESRKNLERRITHMLSRHIPKRSALGLPGLLTLVVIGAMLLPMGRPDTTARAGQDAVQNAPALPEGIAEMFRLTKDDILQAFGEPDRIFYGDQSYTLEDLPDTYYMSYKDISFCVHEGAVMEITLLSPSYVFGNGLRVGDSQEKVKQALGSDCRVEETESKQFLGYEGLGLVFEIDKQDRSVMEINIERDYGDPARLRGYAQADEFAAQLPQKIAQLDIDNADLNQVIATFGPPIRYIWGPEILSADKLPNRFIAVYPSGFRVFMMNDRIVELRHEQGSQYAYAGKLRVGSTLEEALAVLGSPVKTIEGKPIDWSDSNVLFKDIDGREGHCYYHRPDQNVRVWFGNYKVAAIYMTRSDYGDDDGSSPSDPEFARLLAQRIAALDIDAADLEQVKAIFGEPTGYVWGSQSFTADALPDRYIMTYPCGFRVFMSGGRIVEIRHERGSPYVYRGMLRLGSTLQEALDLLGQPQDVVTGQKNTFKEKILYKDIEGNQGHDYYHRPDQDVRVWFAGDKVIAIYMTRSDYSAGGSEPFDAEFASLLAERIAELDIDTAGPDQVRAIFGQPSRYVWGNETFTPDALPDDYIMTYPCSFNVWLQKGRIMEIRHGRASQYAYRGKLRVGSMLQDVLDVLGASVATVTGQKNEFKDGVLYWDVEGNEGQGYYHRSDQRVRVFLWEGKVIAIYMTRSDFPAGD